MFLLFFWRNKYHACCMKNVDVVSCISWWKQLTPFSFMKVTEFQSVDCLLSFFFLYSNFGSVHVEDLLIAKLRKTWVPLMKNGVSLPPLQSNTIPEDRWLKRESSYWREGVPIESLERWLHSVHYSPTLLTFLIYHHQALYQTYKPLLASRNISCRLVSRSTPYTFSTLSLLLLVFRISFLRKIWNCLRQRPIFTRTWFGKKQKAKMGGISPRRINVAAHLHLAMINLFVF